MRLVIMNEKIESPYRNQFVVEVEVMYGDGDGYEKLEISKFEKDSKESMDLIEELIVLLEALSKEYPNGKGGLEGYSHVPNFDKWFSTEILDHDWYESLSEYAKSIYGQVDWPTEPNAWDILANFESYDVFYYGENGEKFKVQIEL